MKLLTKEIEKKLEKAPLCSQEKNETPKILVKFFTPDSSWTWYVTEAEKQPDGDWTFFGMVDGHEKELGYFQLSELQSVRGPLNLPVERDKFFEGQKLNTKTLEIVK